MCVSAAILAEGRAWAEVAAECMLSGYSLPADDRGDGRADTTSNPPVGLARFFSPTGNCGGR